MAAQVQITGAVLHQASEAALTAVAASPRVIPAVPRATVMIIMGLPAAVAAADRGVPQAGDDWHCHLCTNLVVRLLGDACWVDTVPRLLNTKCNIAWQGDLSPNI